MQRSRSLYIETCPGRMRLALCFISRSRGSLCRNYEVFKIVPRRAAYLKRCVRECVVRLRRSLFEAALSGKDSPAVTFGQGVSKGQEGGEQIKNRRRGEQESELPARIASSTQIRRLRLSSPCSRIGGEGLSARGSKDARVSRNTTKSATCEVLNQDRAKGGGASSGNRTPRNSSRTL